MVLQQSSRTRSSDERQRRLRLLELTGQQCRQQQLVDLLRGKLFSRQSDPANSPEEVSALSAQLETELVKLRELFAEISAVRQESWQPPEPR